MVVVMAALWPRFYRTNAEDKQEQPVSDARAETTISSNALYVGSIQALTASLAKEFVIEVQIQAFNGTRSSIAVTALQGFITGGSCPAEGGSVVEIGKLPVPRIKEEIWSVASIRPQAEFYIMLLEQRVPSAIAERMSKVIDAGDSVQLGLNDLNIFVSPTDNSAPKVRLPLWNGISIRKIPDFILSGRIIEASGRITL
jgi:hypothetical protein